jgi:hypothetical protein
MNLDSIANDIRREIAKLTQVLRIIESAGGRAKGQWPKKMSAAARKKISVAQRKRWAKK